jgi:1,4-dihydroxy-6-naphthoate synthase
MNLTLAFSPCPNDTFMFDALVNGRIDTGPFKFKVVLEDVETLNRNATASLYDITKLSFFAYSRVFGSYELLTAGSALGKGVGPLLISKKHLDDPAGQIKSVAVPGVNTTAFFLFTIFYPEIKNIHEYVFSEIEDAVLKDEVDAGVIIHENRFTYAQKGLQKIADLGQLWEESTGYPLPLGGIAVRRDFPVHIRDSINRLVRESVRYAFAHPGASFDYVKRHAQEMDEDVRKKHIGLYVNSFSEELGEEGKNAVRIFLEKAGVNVQDSSFFV